MKLQELMKVLTDIYEKFPETEILLTPYSGPDKDGVYRNNNIQYVEQQPLKSISFHYKYNRLHDTADMNCVELIAGPDE